MTVTMSVMRSSSTPSRISRVGSSMPGVYAKTPIVTSNRATWRSRPTTSAPGSSTAMRCSAAGSTTRSSDRVAERPVPAVSATVTVTRCTPQAARSAVTVPAIRFPWTWSPGGRPSAVHVRPPAPPSADSGAE